MPLLEISLNFLANIFQILFQSIPFENFQGEKREGGTHN